MTKKEVLHLLSTNAMKTIIFIVFLAMIPSGAEKSQAEMRGNELLLEHPTQYLQKQKQNPPSELNVDNNDGNLKVVPLPVSKPRRSPPPPPPPPFDFFVLALQWPKSWCNVKESKCQAGWDAGLDDRFTIHGLWPQFKNLPVGKEKPSVCLPGGVFDYNKISMVRDLPKRLQNQWPNAKFESNQSVSGKSFSDSGFWTHEWADHGSCSWISTQANYFEDTLSIFDRVDSKLREILQTELPPTPNKNIDVTLLENKILDKIKVEPYLKCNSDPSNYEQLHEIHFWIRRDSYNFENYPPKPKNCTRQIVGFPRKQ